MNTAYVEPSILAATLTTIFLILPFMYFTFHCDKPHKEIAERDSLASQVGRLLQISLLFTKQALGLLPTKRRLAKTSPLLSTRKSRRS